MKKATCWASTVAICGLLFLTACDQQRPVNRGTATDTTKTLGTRKVEYTCTMHPEVIADKPGKCHKCGMTLVEKKAKP
ncbi:heavy metal-binding domain-containing protein [Mucilaginibacter ginsenosidivorans]|uniref:Heavy metal binding domain-containing protein n=1 Tax=Mucilaginibacter ginsenosidivorans TaxID=398053 RepID=A0A5B8UST0_9SPHI|nr:heavy metal-binding domain-containing protein [Mucilaginibacter ginsenosidivorans]QEC62054.1 hypothetical protein FRZ54_05430 [Mucilaginibacter ginsenosidivorans]